MVSLGFSKGELYMNFLVEKVSFHKGDPFGWKGLVKVTLNSLLLNLKDPISSAGLYVLKV